MSTLFIASTKAINKPYGIVGVNDYSIGFILLCGINKGLYFNNHLTIKTGQSARLATL